MAPEHPPPAEGWFGAPPYRGTNSLAIASMVLGIVWVFWLGSLLALIFGYVARAQIRSRREGGDAIAVVGITLGWVGVATFVAVLVLVVEHLEFHIGSTSP